MTGTPGGEPSVIGGFQIFEWDTGCFCFCLERFGLVGVNAEFFELTGQLLDVGRGLRFDALVGLETCIGSWRPPIDFAEVMNLLITLCFLGL